MKNKNNLIIIFAVTLTALAVIVIVLFTGFMSGGNESESGGLSSIVSASSEDPASESFDNSSEVESISEVSSQQEVSSAPVSDNVGQRIVSLAVSLIGTPFMENGDSPEGFDNSGFIYYVLRENGYITCPRTTVAQSKMGAVIGRDELKAGDLVFFGNDGSGLADFGGIYIGDGKMVCCQMPGTYVKEVDITTEYYAANFFGGVSVS